MPVIVSYNEGFDTKLLKFDRLEALVSKHGSPKFDKSRNLWVFADGTTYLFKNPFPGDKRVVTGFSVVPWTDEDRELREKLTCPDPVEICLPPEQKIPIKTVHL
jgi:hypothetical protein